MRHRLLAATCAVLALAAGCSSAENTKSLPSSAKSFGQQGKSATKDTAAASATALAARYIQLSSQLDNNTAKSVDDAAVIAADPALSLLRNDVLYRRARGVTIKGDIVFVSSKVVFARVDMKPAIVAVDVCIDTSGRDARFRDGASANAANRLDRGQITLTIENRAWPDDNGWRVTVDSGLRDRTRQRCTS